MNSFERNKTVILGNEYDESLTNRLLSYLKTIGAVEIEKSSGMGGSQEITRLIVFLRGSKITIEKETYIGLTIHGPESIIDEIITNI